MIFEMVDGRTHFYQWDTNRKIKVNDPTIKEVHFCNRTDVCSLVVEVVDGYASVPNTLLQSGYDFRAFAYDGEATLQDAIFKVEARTKPSNYVYTETEIKRYEDLREELINELDSRLDEIAKEGIEVDLDGYYTKGETDELVQSNAEAFFTALTNHNHDERYAGVNHDHPEYLTEHQSLGNYYTKAEVDAKDNVLNNNFNNLINTHDHNSSYYTKSEVDTKINNVKPNVDLSGYAKKSHTHNMSDVEGLQSALNNKASQADIDKAIELHDHRYEYAPIEHSHGDSYAAKSHTHSYNNLLDKPTIPSIEGLASEAYVDAAIANIEIPEAEDVDLSNYYTKEEVDSQISSTTKFETIAAVKNLVGGYYCIKEEDVLKIYNNPLKYKIRLLGADYVYDRKYLSSENNTTATNYLFTAYTFESEAGAPIQDTKNINIKVIKVSSANVIDGKCVITEVTSIDIASKDYVDEAIANIDIPESEPTDLSNYYTKEETNQAIQTALNAIGVAEGGAY